MPCPRRCEIQTWHQDILLAGRCGVGKHSLKNGKTKNKKRKKRDVYALTGFSWAIFMMKKNPSASITVRTESA